MKVNLYFDSTEEFVVFILASSSIKIRCEFIQAEKGVVSNEIDFLSKIGTIHVPGFVYSCELFVGKEYPPMDFHVKNYMLNQPQIENEHILITFDDKRSTIAGLEDVRRYLIRNLPTDFLLRVGWRTDYTDFIFRVNAPSE